MHKYDTNDTYSSIKFVLTYRRKPTYYVVSLIIPCALLALVLYFSYYLPASSGERSGKRTSNVCYTTSYTTVLAV